MPSAITLPTFAEREELLYQKLNAAMQAINAKFAAGVGAAEIAWPLTAGGNLDMSSFNIVNGQQIWGYVNAAEYTTFDDAVTDAGSGGVVLIPPDTTVVTNGSSIVGTGTTVIGAGPSSVLQLTSDAVSGYMLRFDSVTRGMLANLTIDGNSKTGTSQDGVQISSCSGMTVCNVFFRNFSGAGLYVTGGSSQVSVLGCHFNGGDEEHIYATQCNQMSIIGCTFNGGSDAALPVRLACASGSADLTVAIGDCVMDVVGNSGVSFLGYNAIGSASPGRLWMSNVGIIDTGGSAKNGIVAGTSSAVLESCHISNCTVRSTNAGGILVNSNYGNISGNSIDNPATFGVDLDTSRYVTVRGNYIYSASIGVDASAGQTCMVTDNILRSCTTPISYGGTNHAINNNVGAEVGYPLGSVGYYYDGTTPTYSGSVANTVIATVTIPAGVLQQGSSVRIVALGVVGHDGDDRFLYLQVNSQTFAGVFVDATTPTDYVLHGDLYVSSCANSTVLGSGWGVQNGQGYKIIDHKIVTGVDCSTAVEIEIRAEPGTTNVAKVMVYHGHATLNGWG